MPEHPLYVALVWHMHQPYYRDWLTGEISLPWVRLHAAKDYLHMGEVLADHPGVHATINMAPSLTDQMLAWAEGRETDLLAELAERETWTADEQRTILNLAFSVNWDKVIRRYGRYSDLLDRRPAALADPTAFSDGDYRDLLAWFNLAWIDPNQLERDPALAALVAKCRDFTLADLRGIHAKQRALAAGVPVLYRKLVAQGQLELITSPYYHPILPLLADTGAARRPSPNLPLPSLTFSAPEDAASQLKLAVEAHTRHFGAAPCGLWPSEGSVSPEILPLVAAAGFTWLASDEAILGRSLGRAFERDGRNLVTNPRALYQSYRTLAGTELGPTIIFRDHELSDRIGFLYYHLPAKQAADDLIYRLLQIRERLNDSEHPYLVSIILDGENCWEHYEHNGDPFLHAFYGALEHRRELKAVTVSEYLTDVEHHPAGTLAKLATGSWIGGDLTTWIGDPEHNRAWEALARARAHLIAHSPKPSDDSATALAWQALYAAEGSDWFWWYSHRNRSDQDALFDRLFRHNLMAVYRALGDEPPPALAEPINAAQSQPVGTPVAGYCGPVLTAAPYAGDAWALAATLQPASASSGAMQRADVPFERLFVGHDGQHLFLRLDLRDRLDNFDLALYLGDGQTQGVTQRMPAPYAAGLQPPTPLALRWQIVRLPGRATPFLYRAAPHDQWESVGPVTAACGDKTIELALPFATLGLVAGDQAQFLITLAQGGVIVAQLPEHAMATFELQRI